MSSSWMVCDLLKQKGSCEREDLFKEKQKQSITCRESGKIPEADFKNPLVFYLQSRLKVS